MKFIQASWVHLLAATALSLAPWAGQAAAPPFAYITNISANTVSVIDTATNTVMGTVTVGSDPFAFGIFIAPGLDTEVDTEAPTIGEVSNLIAEATSAAGAVVTFPLPAATDAVDPAPVVTASPVSGSAFALGTTVVTVTARDASGNSSTKTFTVTVQDKTAPTIGGLTPNPGLLWPTNHKMVNVTVTARTSDAVSGTTSVCLITGAASSEPDNGLGDGDTANDIGAPSGLSISLRAERSGKGPGRVYSLMVTCSDAAGNSATTTTMVTVPKSQGK